MVSDIPVDVQSGVKSLFQTGREVEFIDFTLVGGGCINRGGRLETSQGLFFLKWNSTGKFPSMFEAEARGLKLLRATNVIYVPEVIANGEAGVYQFLLLEFIEQNKTSKNYWCDLGYQLAQLHKVHSELFGLDHDNYIGSLQQFNFQNSSWIDFFIVQRLQIQLKLAFEATLIRRSELKNFEFLFLKFPSLLPEESPS